MQMIETIPDITLYTDDSTTNWLLTGMVLITGTRHRFFSWLWKFCRRIMKPLLLARQLANVPKKKMLDELQARVSVFCLQSGCLQSFMSTGENNQASFNILWAVLPPGASGKETWGTVRWKEAFLPSSHDVALFLTFFLRCFPLVVWSSYQHHLSPSSPLWLLIFVTFLWFGPLKSFIWMTSAAS